MKTRVMSASRAHRRSASGDLFFSLPVMPGRFFRRLTILADERRPCRPLDRRVRQYLREAPERVGQLSPRIVGGWDRH